MKLFKLLTLVMVMLLISIPTFAANTIVSNGSIISITDIDSDWTLSDTIDLGRQRIHSIQFNPGAADDQCRILDGDASAPPLIDVTSEDIYDQRLKKFPNSRHYMPFLDYSAGTYSAGAEVIIILY